MKVILDTNVFVSGVFFSGPPYTILDAWRSGRIKLVSSPEILDEYQRVGRELATQYPGVDLEPMLELLTVATEVIGPAALSEQVCSDPDDDKFIACALSSRTRYVISGDKHLLSVSGYKGISILRPRMFVDEHLQE